MNKLVYFCAHQVANADNFLCNPRYEHHKWFILRDINWWPQNLASRSHELETPWSMLSGLAPIPEIFHNETRFDIIINQVAEKFCEQVKNTQRIPYIMWSGGIDSTSILVSILKTANKEILDKMVVVCNQNSMDENPYFYHHFIKNKLRTVDTNQFAVTADNYNKILLVDGDCAEMIYAPTHIHILSYMNHFDVINSSWKNSDQLNRSMQNSNAEAVQFGLELIKESIQYSPVPIETIYDFQWWYYFNFKILDSLVRPMCHLIKNLNSQQSADFWHNSYQRFYMYPEMQVWGMITNNYRREKIHLGVKYEAKKYIYDFDHNEFYFYNTNKVPSMGNCPARTNIFAVDENWKRYSFANPEDRRLLGQWLNRI